jgi:hypothetical protein
LHKNLKLLSALPKPIISSFNFRSLLKNICFFNRATKAFFI